MKLNTVAAVSAYSTKEIRGEKSSLVRSNKSDINSFCTAHSVASNEQLTSTANTRFTLKSTPHDIYVGATDGAGDGLSVGAPLGTSVGDNEGALVGNRVGLSVGALLGMSDGALVGDPVGCSVGL